jgi:LPS-assembly lipoprotein
MNSKYSTVGKIISICILLLTLCSCGFHLRSSASLPPQLHQIYLATDNPYGDFEVSFKQALISSGVKLYSSPNQTPLTLQLSSGYSYNATSTGTSTQGRVYALNYSATFTLLNAKNQTLIEPTSVSTTRNLTLAPNEVFDVSAQVDTIKNEMKQELTTKILNILGSKSSFKILGQPPKLSPKLGCK